MRRIIFAITVVAAFVVGCVTAQTVVPDAQATIEGSGGNCFAATLWYEDGKSVNAGTMPKTVQVPAGYHAVGGVTVGPGMPGVVFCSDG